MFFVQNRRWVFLAWVVVVIACAALSGSLSNVLQRAFTAPGSNSAHGSEVLKKAFSDGGEYPFVIVVTSPVALTTQSVPIRELEHQASRIAAFIPHGERHKAQIVRGTTAYAAVTSKSSSANLASLTPAIRHLTSNANPRKLLLTGTAALEYDSHQVLDENLTRAELVALPLAAIVLVLLLQTVAAALVPVILALVVIPTSLGVIWLLAHVTDMSIYVTNVATLLGIALSLDYSLLIVSRLQEERRIAPSYAVALERTLATAGRTAAFSAVTVATGLAVLLLIPLPFMRSMGLAGVVVPLVAAAATLTLLPCILATLGVRIDKWRLVPAEGHHLPGKRAIKWADSIVKKHPVRSFIVGATLLLALAAPATAISVTGGDIRSLPQGMPSDQGLNALTSALGPGALTPYQVVLQASQTDRLTSERARADISRLVFALSRDPEIVDSEASPIGTRSDSTGHVVEIGFIGRHAAGSPQAAALVGRLRNQYAGLRPPGTQIYVSGAAALGVDFVNITYGRFLWIVLAIVGLGLVLLTYAFRSLLLPVKAVVLNCVSVAASVGVVVLVVQTGFDSHFGFRHASQIEAWVPAFLFAVLFGLSMDYHIFIVSRIREEWQRTGSIDDAVTNGMKRTGNVVRAAAAVMIVTFAGFMTSSFADVQKLGIGLSVGVALDVLLVRGLLVPSAMRVAGRWNWYWPGIDQDQQENMIVPSVIGETSD
jgi:RND superfamily putative drug exporter